MLLTLLPVISCLPNQALQYLQNGNPSWIYPPTFFIKKKLFVFKGQEQGCLFKENLNQTLVCYGIDCRYYPSHYTVNKKRLKIKMTSIEVIREYDFINLSHLTLLVIEYNANLTKLEPGCFKPLKSLTELKIILNPQLIFLHARVFDGLNSLIQLSLKNNGFKHISDFSPALSPNSLTALRSLDLSENTFRAIFGHEFAPMNNTSVENLFMNLCGIEIIDEDAMTYFKSLRKLDLGENHFSINNMTQVVVKFIENNIPIDTLYLYDLGYKHKPPYELLEMIAKTNITTLSLAQNHFEHMTAHDFPYMSKIKSLDLSESSIVSIEPGTFDGLTNLETLYLGENKFSKILPAILLPQLHILDLRMISYKSESISYFNIPNNVFINMTGLEQLRLSHNAIESINKYSFNGLKNLKYLELKNATLFHVGNNVFDSNKRLLYLNLENNPFQQNMITSNTFKELSELRFLFLGGCNIYNLSLVPSPFYNLSKLTYLSLNNNILYTMPPHIFSPLISLESLDLSNNKLIPWNERIFENLPLKNIDVSQNKFTFLTEAMLDDFKNVEYLNLDGNPFICDCNLLPLTESVNILNNTNITNILDTKCSNVEWQQKTIYDFILYMNENPHSCDTATINSIPLISLAIIFLIIFITLSILMYVYRQYIKYWLFITKMTIRRKSKWWRKDTKIHFSNFVYDAFVSYSYLDCSFVNKLVSQLEDNEPYLKLCVYERDFKVGSIISEEVLQNILKSKRTLLIISDGFVKSHWCRWETKLAEYHQIFFQNDDGNILDDTLVMIKLNEVQKKHLTPTLKYLMKTRIYLQWDSKNETEFWKKLRATLSAPKNKIKCRIEETIL